MVDTQTLLRAALFDREARRRVPYGEVAVNGMIATEFELRAAIFTYFPVEDERGLDLAFLALDVAQNR